MKHSQDLIIEPLQADHDRTGFSCHEEALDRYIHKQAGQDIRRGISRVFVAVRLDKPREIVGYYSLSALSIALNQLPENMARRLPRHPIPAALIGRLGVSKRAQGCGIGRMLLVDAIQRTLSVRDQIAIHAMVVDAVDDTARAFYEQYGFKRLTDCSNRLFLPLHSL
ncbi:GNAT family N-acetyltransferase [Desulfoplanes sp.]